MFARLHLTCSCMCVCGGTATPDPLQYRYRYWYRTSISFLLEIDLLWCQGTRRCAADTLILPLFFGSSKAQIGMCAVPCIVCVSLIRIRTRVVKWKPKTRSLIFFLARKKCTTLHLHVHTRTRTTLETVPALRKQQK